MLHHHERMAANAPDRVAVRRRDDAWLTDAFDRSKVLVVSARRVRAVDGRPQWLPAGEAPAEVIEGRRVLLGEVDGEPRFAVILAGSVAHHDDPDHHLSLRDLLPTIAALPADDPTPPLVFHALGIAEWLAATRYCPRCGLPLELRRAGHELVCAEGHVQFPRLDPAVIMSVTSGEPGTDAERLLLGRQAGWPEGRYSTLAGFCEPGETLEDAVRREVLEEAGVVVGDVDYFGSQPWPLPQSLMLGFLGRATSEAIELGDDELADARWVTRAELSEESEAGTLVLPGGVSISRSLIEHWYGGSLPGSW